MSKDYMSENEVSSSDEASCNKCVGKDKSIGVLNTCPICLASAAFDCSEKTCVDCQECLVHCVCECSILLGSTCKS